MSPHVWPAACVPACLPALEFKKLHKGSASLTAWRVLVWSVAAVEGLGRAVEATKRLVARRGVVRRGAARRGTVTLRL